MTLIKVYPPALVRNQILNYSVLEEPQEFYEKRKGPTIGEIDKALAHRGDNKDYLRRLIIGWLTVENDKPIAPVSSKILTPQQWNGFWLWVGSEQQEDNKWYPRAAFPVECNWVCTRVMFDYHRSLEYAMTHGGKAMTMQQLLENVPNIEDIPTNPIEINPENIIACTMRSMPGTMPIGDSMIGATTAAEASNRVMHRLMNKEAGLSQDADLPPEIHNDYIDETQGLAPAVSDEEPEFGY